MSRAARAPTTVDQLIAARGGHNVGVWKAQEPAAFAWLTTRLDGSRKSAVAAAPACSARSPETRPYRPFTHD